MFGLTLSPAVAAFLSKWGIGITGAVILLAVLSLAYCSGGSSQKTKDENAALKRENTVQIDLGNAAAGASVARVQDAVELEQQKEDLHDAIDNATDPDDVRRRTGCVILRQQGRDTSGVPACAGL